MRIKIPFYLSTLPSSVFRDSGCLIKLTIHVTLVHLHVILTHFASKNSTWIWLLTSECLNFFLIIEITFWKAEIAI